MYVHIYTYIYIYIVGALVTWAFYTQGQLLSMIKLDLNETKCAAGKTYQTKCAASQIR